MDSSESEKLFINVGFLNLDAAWLAKATERVCVLMGLAAGAGLAISGIKSATAPLQEAPKPKMNALIILAGLGLGVAAIGGACTMIKNRIFEIVNSYDTADAALRGMTQEQKASLIGDGRRLLAMRAKIDDLMKDQEPVDSRYSA